MSTTAKPTKRIGRPPKQNPEPLQQVNIMLHYDLVERAREIGDGNLTEGIRRAVRGYREAQS